ncbi:kinase-like protein [Rickenella mellea]|uniref:Kinase-like protein n=1 Tax=Rickenella mellea TaxID=50990 RepID=A0A4Y7PQJ9_9AGAM|nr:kinase-like protein [Rickenella mellea]
MGTPVDHLPNPLEESSIQALLQSTGLPACSGVTFPKVAAQYHSIYILSFPAPTLVSSELTVGEDLVLRVSGHHIPKIKTENEVAVITWIRKNTSIPVPEIVAYDSSCDNPIGYEYVLMSRVSGTSLDKVYKNLTKYQMSDIIDELVDVLDQLHSTSWSQIGGLKFGADGTIIPGPVVEETFWHIPDIAKFWGPQETFGNLNIGGPFDSYVGYVSAHINKYLYAIRRHESLAYMRDMLPRLEMFLDALSRDAVELNNVKLRLAHKDLHFGNIMYDSQLGKISAILDWEFSGIVPYTRWNPTRAFMWNAGETEAGHKESAALYAEFVARCQVRNAEILDDAEFSSDKQRHMQMAANFLRAIVEVSPRGQRKEKVGEWKEQLLEHMSAFAV